jgi:hypothetical protein
VSGSETSALLRSLPAGVDAVVSLCRVGKADLPAHIEQIDVRLIDQPDANGNLDFVLLDTMCAVEQLRREGRTVPHQIAEVGPNQVDIASRGARDGDKLILEKGANDPAIGYNKSPRHRPDEYHGAADP